MRKKVTPMLTTLVDQPFDDKAWIFEIKFDGYRALAYKNRSVELLSRYQLSFTPRFPPLVDELKKIRGPYILDGEIVIMDEKGRSHFQLLQNYQKDQIGTPYYFVFDILSLNGKDLTHLPLLERKKILKKLLSQTRLRHIKYTDHIQERGKAFFRLALKKGLEGIIAKRADSPYQFRRSRDWLKIKTTMRQEVVIGGFTEPKGSRKFLGALLVGVYDQGKLKYVGNVGGGFNQSLLEDTYHRLSKIISPKCPFIEVPKSRVHATWVKPKLVCEVAFSEWTKGGMMRQPIFKGLRADKPAKKVIKEKIKHFTKE